MHLHVVFVLAWLGVGCGKASWQVWVSSLKIFLLISIWPLRAFLNCWFQCMLQEFIDARDADDARHYVNGKDFDGNRLIVEFARRVSIGMYFRLSVFTDA